MSTTVTMRPRRLSTPAISPDDSGTRGQPFRHEHVLHPGDRQPEQLAADQRGDEFGTAPSVVSVLLVMLASLISGRTCLNAVRPELALCRRAEPVHAAG